MGAPYRSQVGDMLRLIRAEGDFDDHTGLDHDA